MTDLRPSLERARELDRLGDAGTARQEAEAALAADPDNPELLHFLGLLSCRSGALAEGEAFLRRALQLDPAATDARADFAMALAAMGRTEEALTVCAGAPGGDSDVRLARVEGQLLQSSGRHSDASAAYRRFLEEAPDDWEIWNNLGSACWAAGDTVGTVAALRRAAELRPNMLPIQANLASVLAAAGQYGEALDAFQRALAIAPGEPQLVLAAAKLLRQMGRSEQALGFLEDAPDDPDVLVERGRNHSALHRLDEAESAYRSAIRRRRGYVEALLELGIVLERSGRVEEVVPLLDQGAQEGVAAEALAYLRALVLAREGRSAEALEWAQRAPPQLEPVRVQRLVARLADVDKQPSLAFAAAERANRATVEEEPGALDRAERFRSYVQALNDVATEEWLASLVREPVPSGPSPAFLVGFPRSGTTLLDTFLMGHKRTHVLEEIPLVERVMAEAGDMARLPDLDEGEVERLRRVYLSALDAESPPPHAATVIDKLPLNILATPLIHRIFPDARFILALRHPCDVVLSCFMQGFEVNDAMANFLDIETTSRLYDLVFTFWERCRGVLPLRVHELRYEQLVADPEAVIRPLADFLGLAWDEAMLNHRKTAVERGLISTPSYNQVTHGLYGHASGRWTRYREQLAPVLPMLRPWALRFGYGDPEP